MASGECAKGGGMVIDKVSVARVIMGTKVASGGKVETFSVECVKERREAG